MFPTVAGVPMYPVFQTATVALFLALAYAYLMPVSRRTLHAIGLTTVYALCNFVAAKLLFDLRNTPEQFDWLNYLRPGHYFAGGFWGWPAAFLPAVALYPLVLRLDRAAIYRAVSLTLPPVLMVQKVACLAIGCCTGRPSDVPWAMTFVEGSQCPTPGVPVHPVPIYDLGIALALYGVLMTLDRSPRTRAFLFPVLVVGYGLNRFATEFFRPEYEGHLSTRQLLAVGAAVGALGLLLIFPRRWRRWVENGGQREPHEEIR